MASITLNNADELSDCLNQDYAHLTFKKISNTESVLELTSFSKIHLSRHTLSFDVILHGEIPKDYYSFFLASGEQVFTNGKPHQEGTMVLLPPGKEFFNYSRGPFTMCNISVPKKKWEDFIPTLDESYKFPSSGMAQLDSIKVQNFKSLFQEILDYKVLEKILVSSEKEVTFLEQQILQTLADVFSSSNPINLEMNEIKNLALLNQALKKIEKHVDEHLGVAEIARELNISRRSLQTLFTDYFGLSPLKFINLRRMNLVREALRHCDPESTSIANIAAQHGFWHLGRFAGNYRELFGELPSETFSRKDSSNQAIKSLKNITDNFFFR